MKSPELDDRVHFRDVLPIAVPDSLDELRGPSEGELELPRSIYWGPDRHVDLAVGWQLRKAYRHILRSGSADLIVGMLNAETLVAVWPTLVLDDRISEAWTKRYPELKMSA